MLTLYVKDGCPFCRKVLDVGEDLGISFEIKNTADKTVVAELVERGGKEQTPYLYDSDTDMGVYESGLITTYLKEQYKK